jgi:hypothetical protein
LAEADTLSSDPSLNTATIHLVAANGETQAQSIHAVVCDFIDARGRLDEAFADQATANGRVGWLPSITPAVERWSWIDVIVRLVGIEGGRSSLGQANGSMDRLHAGVNSDSPHRHSRRHSTPCYDYV